MSAATIIHRHAALTAAIGAGLAPVPGSDGPAIAAVQMNMIAALADRVGASKTRAQCAELLLTMSATVTGRQVSALVLGRVPGFGSAVNAATAAALTEAIGWAAVHWLSDGS